MSKPQTITGGIISRIRRNHALEHATLQVLATRTHSMLAGYSDPAGFWVVGSVSTEELQTAAEEALTRLKAGEYALAIHPNCGTNFAVSGIAAGALGWLGMLGDTQGARKKLDRLPTVIWLVTIGLILAAPLGPLLQARVTTQAQVGNLAIKAVVRYPRRIVTLQRVLTKG